MKVMSHEPQLSEPGDFDLHSKSFLVTGQTGSFGKRFVKHVLEMLSPRRVVVFSRDELKQSEMAQNLSPQKYPALRYFLRDVRDRGRLEMALRGVDIVVHAAALTPARWASALS
jgi:UDP-N-acetylglucosamine 4,6-dehydratase